MNIRFVTSNEGKASEVRAMLEPLGYKVERINTTYPELQVETLEAVVNYGLEWMSSRVEEPFIIDDSGLFVEALKGFPGVYSAHAYKTLGWQGILKLLEGAEDRSARFECCAGLVIDGKRHIFTGVTEGSISEAPRGESGFGFDPVFVPNGTSMTFAEMDHSIKNRISHRGRAFSALMGHLAEAAHAEKGEDA
ncbi:MAG: XTP/dITP diphosphatase [Methanobacteriota archaeon]